MQSLKKRESICLNATIGFLAVTLNIWDDTKVYTTRSFKGKVTEDGPYSTSDDIGGFDFGKSIGTVIIRARKSTDVSVGAFAFSKNLTFRIFSNHPDDEISFTKTDTETLPITPNQCVEYFNGSPGQQNYEVKLQYTTNNGDLYFCGQENTHMPIDNSDTVTRMVEFENPEVVEWITHDRIDSDYFYIKVKVSNYKPDKFIRFVTNGDRYTTVPSSELQILSTDQIIGLAVGCILVLVVLIVIVVFSVKCVKRRHKNQMNFEGDTDIEKVKQKLTEENSVSAPEEI